MQAPEPDIEQARPARYLENSDVSSIDENADQTRIMRLLQQFEEKSSDYVMSAETMKSYALDLKIQIIRLAVCIVLMLMANSIEVKSEPSKLDKAWITDMLWLLIALFLFFNIVYILPHVVESPIIIIIAMRVLCGIVFAQWAHIYKGMTLYSELKKPQEAHDSYILHSGRIILLIAFILFNIYLTVSIYMLWRLAGIDAARLRRRGNNRRFKRIPFGNLYFKEGLDCSICFDRFTEKQQVVQLACHESHVFHRTCITQWVERGREECPLCREPIAVAN